MKAKFQFLGWMVVMLISIEACMGLEKNDESGNDMLHHQQAFKSFILTYNKSYTSSTEMQRRFELFRQRFDFIQKHNAYSSRSWTAAINEFSDWTYEEFIQRRLGAKSQDCAATAQNSDGGEASSHVIRRNVRRTLHQYKKYKTENDSHHSLPSHVDWREKGIISPVEDQSECGSCWAFSTTGALEAHAALYTRQHIQLSQQNLIDCAQQFKNNGCDGGLPSQAFEYVRYNGGLDFLSDYPYEGVDGSCRFDPEHVGVQVEQVVNITANDEDELTWVLAFAGPVSVAYDCSEAFMSYESGVFTDPDCGTAPQMVNHAVLFIGYGTTPEGIPYYIAKNSWGTEWGEDGGYFRIFRGSNECGLADCASYPVLKF